MIYSRSADDRLVLIAGRRDVVFAMANNCNRLWTEAYGLGRHK